MFFGSDWNYANVKFIKTNVEGFVQTGRLGLSDCLCKLCWWNVGDERAPAVLAISMQKGSAASIWKYDIYKYKYKYMNRIEIMIVVLDSWLVSRIPKPPTQTNKNF